MSWHPIDRGKDGDFFKIGLVLPLSTRGVTQDPEELDKSHQRFIPSYLGRPVGVTHIRVGPPPLQSIAGSPSDAVVCLIFWTCHLVSGSLEIGKNRFDFLYHW